MTDLRAVMRALPCRRCMAVPGGWCQSGTGNTGPFHRERREDAANLSPEDRAAVVAAHAAGRAARIAELDTKPLTADQQAIREAVTAAWGRILEETR